MSGEVAELRRELTEVKEQMGRLAASVAVPLSAERLITIKEIARATNRGDNAPLKQWNKQRKLELGL